MHTSCSHSSKFFSQQQQSTYKHPLAYCTACCVEYANEKLASMSSRSLHANKHDCQQVPLHFRNSKVNTPSYTDVEHGILCQASPCFCCAFINILVWSFTTTQVDCMTFALSKHGNDILLGTFFQNEQIVFICYDNLAKHIPPPKLGKSSISQSNAALFIKNKWVSLKSH